MLIRPKLFLLFLGLCLLPLVLLASINYWNGVRLAASALHAEQEDKLTNFKAQVAEILNQDRKELARLGRSQPLLKYLQFKNEENAESPGVRSIEKSGIQNRVIATNASEVVPLELRVTVASVLSSRGHFASISLFDRNRRPNFTAQQKGDYDEPIVFQTSDFLSGHPRPDDRVWTAKTPSVLSDAAPILNPQILIGSSGAHMNLTMPVSVGQVADTPQGALVGELKLDPIFSEAASEHRNSPDSPGGGQLPVVLVVIEHSGKILYHSNQALQHRLLSESLPDFKPVATQMFTTWYGSQTFASTTGDQYLATYQRISEPEIGMAVVSNYGQALRDARWMGRTGFVVAVLLGVLAATLLTYYWQRQTRGLERVTEGVEAIAQGKLDHRIELRSSDDLRPLADNLGLMTKQLRDQIAREAETRQFQSFVRLSAILTHDLKNAIEALSLTVSNMERHFDNKDFRADAMKSVTGATDNLRAMVERLSNPVTTLSGEHKRPRPVDLIPMLRRVITVIAEPARGKHQIKIDIPESLPALVDSERMNKIVENLIINALEAMNQENGTLSIVAGMTDEGKPYFSVSDTGEGMSQRFIKEKLYRPFATTKKRGVGLGLYTCREVVVANGGSIEVDSREGVGTTFRVVLPSAAIDKGGEKNPHSQSHN